MMHPFYFRRAASALAPLLAAVLALGAAPAAALPVQSPLVAEIGAAAVEHSAELEPAAFSELWAYLMVGEEAFLEPARELLSDVCYFSAEINAYGELIKIPDVRKLSSFAGRKHLVVAEIGNFTLTHLCLDPAYPIRARLVASIAAAAKPYDGVQVDFEAIPERNRDDFVDFLKLLKKAIGPKLLSVALPARLSAAGDTLGYARIAAVVDRVVIMAYDEHWSTSAPGPVASLDWCARVASYASSRIPAERLVMGLPFYGRAWGDKRPNRAYKHSGIGELAASKGVNLVGRENGIPWFRYEETVVVDVYYDDALSLRRRLGLYETAGVGAVAFWRLGQEDPDVWARMRRN